MENTVAYMGLLFLATAFLFLVISIRKGKQMINYIKQRYPEEWNNLGNPEPGYFNSMQLHSWRRFIWKKEYLDFDDRSIAELGRTVSILEMTVVSFTAAFVLCGGLLIWLY